MNTLKIENDFENFYLFQLDIVEAAKKMPSFRPRKVAIPLADNWVTPSGNFYEGSNYKNASEVIPDIAVWGLGYLIVSEKACEVLGGSMTNSGELLPVDIDGVIFYLFNCTYVLPDSAVDKSNAVERIDLGLHVGSENVVVDHSQLESRSLFRANFDRKVSLYCTDAFRALMEEGDLGGLDFERI